MIQLYRKTFQLAALLSFANGALVGNHCTMATNRPCHREVAQDVAFEAVFHSTSTHFLSCARGIWGRAQLKYNYVSPNIFSYLGFFQFGPRRVCSNRVTCQAKHVFDAIPQLAIYRHKTYECVHSPRTRTETARKWSWRRLSWKRKVWSCRYATAARAWWCILCRAGEVATGKEAPRMNRILDLSQKNVMRLKTWSKRWMPCQLTATFFSSLVNSNQITAEHCDECEMSARDAGLCLEKITISVVYLE